MILLLTIIFFVFGLIIGSFLNVVILRLNTQKTFGGRSACMSCRNTLSWYELFPVFSFLWLGGKCRNCKTKISIQYPLVELVTGLIFAAIFLKFQDIFFLNTFSFSFTYAYYAVVFSLLLVIAVYDIRHKIIPDSLSLTLGILTFLGLFIFGNSNFLGYFGFFPHIPSLLEFLAGPLIAAPFALLWLVSGGRWMGLGDAKLALSIGWLLGLSGALSGVVMAFWAGAVIGIILIIFSSKHGMKSEIPFAPYLVLGTALAFIFSLSLFGLF
ncbi:prepilin peptidase [Candidatus Nomurabacteria bacterium]|nr:prepilin peptidase [Candidatus Nomurabacteria bacterium]